MSEEENQLSEHPFISAFNEMQCLVNENAVAHGFHEGEEATDLNVLGNKMMLMVGELSEAHETIRKNDLDHPCEKDVDITALEEEFADVIIRIMDTAGELTRAGVPINLGRAIIRKHKYNVKRPYKHGKKF